MNFSDRFLGIVAGTKPPGNDPHKVVNEIRHSGLIPETMLPFDKDLLSSVEDYYSFKGADETKCREEGQKFLDKYEIGHEWVFTSSQTRQEREEKIKECLRYSPLGVSVTAWVFDDATETYIDNGIPNTHWCVIYGWNEKGWLIFDSYDQSRKVLSFDHNIQMAKRYMLKKKEVVKDILLDKSVSDIKRTSNWFIEIMANLLAFLKDIIKVIFKKTI